MLAAERLRESLRRTDRKGYKAYKDIKGSYDFGAYQLFIDSVQGDPYASPSRVAVRVSIDEAQFPPGLISNRSRRIALEDYLTRAFSFASYRIAKGKRGTGNSGLIQTDHCGQEVLERSSCRVGDGYIELRFFMGLPAAGRTVLGREAEEMFFAELPRIVESSLFYKSLDASGLYLHVETAEDQDYIRQSLSTEKLLAFVAEGSLLPRRSGIDERPLVPFKGFRAGGNGEKDLGDGHPAEVVLFQVPESLRVELITANAGPIAGMGIPEGVTLIVGGGFHGKSTLLRALERGVYNHIPGDGREYAVTRADAVKIRAEDGRSVTGVDISPFINDLPFGKDTTHFTTQNGSGSTSQAANIMEALEAGSKLLLIDEDTSATNFMIRDGRMQALVPKGAEPITPFIDRVRQLFLEHGVSTILVMGGSGDYFDVADTVIRMDNYRPVDVTAKAQAVAGSFQERRAAEGSKSFGPLVHRIPLPQSFSALRRGQEPEEKRRGVQDSQHGREKITVRSAHTLIYGGTAIDLSCLAQLVDTSQTRAIGEAIRYAATRIFNGRVTLKEAMATLDRDTEKRGLDLFFPPRAGNLARPRAFEIAAAINRMRTLIVKQCKTS